jgi:alkylated DNA repair dioxygenase AlkB
VTAPGQLTLLEDEPGAPVDPPAARWLVGSAPPGLRLLERWLSADEELALLAGVDAGEWRTDIARRVQQHGLRYSGRRTERPQVVPGGLPDWMAFAVDRLEDEHVLVRRAEQCNVNEYLPGQGIAAHVDVAHFGPKVALVSLLATTVMTFEPGPGTAGERAELLLPNRSLVVLDGEVRSGWRHGIPKRKHDRIDDARVPRPRRVSLTFRTVADD